MIDTNDIKFAVLEEEEMPIQLCSYKDGQFNGVAILTNRGDVYCWSNRFSTWTKLPKFNKEEEL